MKHFVNLSMEKEKPNDELFHGFQMIRAIETDRFISGLETATPTTYVENITKYETSILKLARMRLERALSFDCNACYLQRPNEVKHNRTTLSELFQKTKIADEKTETESNIIRKGEEKKKRTSTTYSVSAADERRHKNIILQMLCLEKLSIAQNMRTYVKKSNVVSNEETEGYRNRHKMLPEDIIIFPYTPNPTKSKVSHPTYASTNRKRERWIKSDAEYLILEL